MDKQTIEACGLVTGRIIQQSGQGAMPWQVPWGTRGMPYNLLTKKPYRGINVWLLNSTQYPTNCYVTQRQVRDMRLRIRARETAHLIVCQSEGEDNPLKGLSLCKAYNVAQCEGITKALLPSPSKVGNPVAICEEIIATIPNGDDLTKGISIGHIRTFDTPKGYYDQLFHLMVSTALKRIRFDAEMPFSHAQLATGMGAAYLSFFAGFEQASSAPLFRDTGLWRDILRKNCTIAIVAAHCAQMAADRILGYFTDGSFVAEMLADEISTQNKRNLKVYYSQRSTRFKKQPMIRLEGNYLEEAGFSVGDRIEVGLENRQITISKT